MSKFFLKYFIISSLFLNFEAICLSQSKLNFFSPAQQVDNNRLIPLLTIEGTVYASSMIGLDVLWYKDYPRSAFHFFDDNKEWQQMDKFGHCLTAYTISRITSLMFQWSGMKALPAAVYGTTLGLSFQTNIEVFDGFSSEWGFSYGDMLANTTGASIFLSEETGWGDQRVMLKFSFHPTDYAPYRPNELGDNLLQQSLKDYNGQTYWVSIAIASFLPERYKIPGWACLDFGYGAEGMIGAVSNPPVYDANGDELYFDRYRKYFVSLDINLTKIPTNSGFLKATFGAVSFIKIPFPTLQYSRKKFRFYWLYF